MSRRFAIYFAPPAGSALAAFGRDWLGRDHLSGGPARPPAVPGLAPERQREITAFPRHYGFHATLKAPFELHPERTRAELVEALAEFAAGRLAFDAPPVEPRALADFIAFQLAGPSPGIDRLAAACVRAFEPYRAPLRPEEILRRRAGGLTARQDRYLLEWGYPYVFEEFRFHMTLTGRLDEPERSRVLDALCTLARPIAGNPLRVDALGLYEQRSREEPFLLTARFPFGPA